MFDPEKICSTHLLLVAKCCEEKSPKHKDCKELIKHASACVSAYSFMSSKPLPVSSFLAFISKS